MALSRLRFVSCFLVLILGIIAANQPARGAEESGAQIYQRTLLSTAWIVVPVGEVRTEDGIRTRLSTGTGTLIDSGRRLVLTNYHVVGEKDLARVYFPVFKKKGSPVVEREFYLKEGRAVAGKVLTRDPRRDLAVIQLETVPEGVKPIKLCREGPGTGQRLYSIGNPGNSKALWVYTPGEVRTTHRDSFLTGGKDGIGRFTVEAEIVETTSPVNSGDSGGPVVNDKGELVAVVQGHLDDKQARLVSIFISVSEVHALLRDKKLAKLPPPPRESDKPKEVETTSSEKTVAKPEDDVEAKAHRQLTYAKGYYEDGKLDKAREKYKDIIAKFPKTKAAEEAKELLEKLDK